MIRGPRANVGRNEGRRERSQRVNKRGEADRGEAPRALAWYLNLDADQAQLCNGSVGLDSTDATPAQFHRWLAERSRRAKDMEGAVSKKNQQPIQSFMDLDLAGNWQQRLKCPQGCKGGGARPDEVD